MPNLVRSVIPLRGDRPAGALAVAALAIGLCAGAPASATPFQLPPGFSDQLITGGLQLPTAFAFVPGGDRQLVTELYTGRVRLVLNGAIAATDPVLTVDSLAIGAERGLLGIAVDPRWPAPPYVYLNHSRTGGLQSIFRYEATGDLAGTGSGVITLDPLSRREVLRIPDAAAQHNGGGLAFGPDGHLYASLGDDNDPCEAVHLDSPRGRLLRLDVSALPPGPGGPPAPASLVPAGNPYASDASDWARLTWAYGFRNPFTFHVDPATGDAFVADVGELVWEEFDWVKAAAPGAQYGWGWYEGPIRSIFTCGFDSTGAVPPIWSYSHEDSLENAEAAISAGLYRPVPGGVHNFPAAYDGDYFISDFYGGWIKRLERTGDTWALAPAVPGQPHPEIWATSSGWNVHFAVGPDGGLWYLAQLTNFGPDPSGELRRISANPVAAAPGPGRADGLALAPPHPSPAAGPVAFRFALPRAAAARLEILDLTGRRVATLVAGAMGAGAHAASWDGRTTSGSEAPAGVYRARLTAEGGSVTRAFVRLH